MKAFLLLIIFSQLSFSQIENNYSSQLYSLIITEQLNFGRPDSKDSIIIVNRFNDKTINLTPSMLGGAHGNIDKLQLESKQKQILKSLISNLKPQHKIIDDVLDIDNVNIKIVSHKDFLVLKKEERKKNINPNFYLWFSGINYQGNYAVISYNYNCGGKCAAGELIFFKKKDDEWSILTQINLWIA